MIVDLTMRLRNELFFISFINFYGNIKVRLVMVGGEVLPFNLFLCMFTLGCCTIVTSIGKTTIVCKIRVTDNGPKNM